MPPNIRILDTSEVLNVDKFLPSVIGYPALFVRDFSLPRLDNTGH